MKIFFFHWPSTVEPVINQSSWASAEESNIFFCKQKHAHDKSGRGAGPKVGGEVAQQGCGEEDCGEAAEVVG